MAIFRSFAILAGVLALQSLIMPARARANPYPDQREVPLDPARTQPYAYSHAPTRLRDARDGADVLRIEMDWGADTERFTLAGVMRESSGTPSLSLRSRKEDALGSFRGVLLDPATREPIAYDALGTGAEFRKLARAVTFRFPMPKTKVIFQMEAENVVTGAMERVYEELFDPHEVESAKSVLVASEIDSLRDATAAPKLYVNIYSEGYVASRKQTFLEDARRVVEALGTNRFPGFEHMEFRAVFAPSAAGLGAPRPLGTPVRAHTSTFLGLYYPYWDDFGRWSNVLYPTSERRYRDGIASAPYDYAIALVDSDRYFGSGNYRELVAVPAHEAHFTYLLLHELGHLFGLNEEYEGGGPTELSFAPGIAEPWSQNITFLRSDSSLKWRDLVSPLVPVPTPASDWTPSSPLLGAYPGGYADSEPIGHSFKPGFDCVMGTGHDFCPVCLRAIEERVRFDLGG